MSDTQQDSGEKDRLPMLRKWFTEAEDGTSENREEAERARDYYDGRQLTAAELATLAARGQPPVIDNRIKPKVNYLLGLEKRGRTDPKAFPRNPADEQGAHAATDAIRYVCDLNLFEEICPLVLTDMLVEGMGGVDLTVQRTDTGDHKIILEHFPWDRLFFDPHSRAYDFADAKYLGGVLWMDDDSVLARWPGADPAIAGAYEHEGSSTSDTYDDRPLVWADPQRKRVRVIQLHWMERGEWWLATFTAGGFLDEPMRSPYTDDEGKSECSLILQSGYIDRKNWRYGIVRDMIDPQDEVNKRRSKALHLLSVRQVVAEQGAVLDVDKARAELARPDGFLEVTPGLRFDIQQTGDLATGQFALLQEAKASLEATGPNAFLMGKQTQAASGRAIMASQQGGEIEIDGAIMDRFHQFKRRVYRTIWNRVRQFWTAEKYVRVTDDERNVRFVGLNRMVTLGEELASMPPDKQQAAAAQLGLVPGDPRLAQPVRIENNVAEMTVDIVVEEAPDVATLQAEQFGMLAEMASKMPGLIPPDALIEASSLRNKDKLLEKMKGPTGPDGQPVPPPPPPEVLRMQAEMQLKQQQAQQDAANQQAKMAMDAQAAARQAEIEAMKAQAQIAMDQRRLDAEIALQEQRLAAEMELRRYEIEGKMHLARVEAAARSELSRDVAADNAEARREAMAEQPAD
jgi:hypothetical protein